MRWHSCPIGWYSTPNPYNDWYNRMDGKDRDFPISSYHLRQSSRVYWN